MKRFKLVVFLGIVILSVYSGTFNEAFATEKNNFSVKTKVVSEDIKTYAENNLAVYLNGMLEIEGTSDSLKDYVLGVPFSLLDENTSSSSIVFPVLKNESVVYTFFLKDENGEYTTKLSKMLVDELNFLKSKDFSEGISLIASENGDIYYENNGEITLLWSSPEALSEGKQTDPENVLLEKVNNSDLEVVNLNESLEYNVDVYPKSTSNGSTTLRSTTVDKFGTRINWKISETQGDDKWCIAYAAAMILNNKNDARPTKAADIGKWGKRGKNTGFTDDEIVKYANTRGVYPKLLSRPTTWSETVTQLRKSNGVLGVWESQVHTWHAIDITGTYMSDTANGRKNVFVIWNPWRTYVELIDAPTNKPIKYIANSDRTYTWRRSITNW